MLFAAFWNALFIDLVAAINLLAPNALIAYTAEIKIVIAGVNFNVANTDTAVVIPAGLTQRYKIVDAILTNASASISTATVGLFAATGGVGQVIANQAITVTSAAANTNNNSQSLTLTNQNTEAFSTPSLFVRVGTAQGSPATADVVLILRPLT